MVRFFFPSKTPGRLHAKAKKARSIITRENRRASKDGQKNQVSFKREERIVVVKWESEKKVAVMVVVGCEDSLEI